MLVNAFGVPTADVADAMTDSKVLHGMFVRCLQQPEPLGALIGAATCALETSLASLPTRAPLFDSLASPLFRATMAALGGVGSELATDACHADFVTFDCAFPLLAAGAPLFAFPAAAAALRRLAARFDTDTLYCTEDAAVSELMRARRRLFLAVEGGAGGSAEERDPQRRRWHPTSHGRIQASMVWAAGANTVPTALWTVYWLARDCVARERVASEILSRLEAEPDVEIAVPDPHPTPVPSPH